MKKLIASAALTLCMLGYVGTKGQSIDISAARKIDGTFSTRSTENSLGVKVERTSISFPYNEVIFIDPQTRDSLFPILGMSRDYEGKTFFVFSDDYLFGEIKPTQLNSSISKDYAIREQYDEDMTIDYYDFLKDGKLNDIVIDNKKFPYQVFITKITNDEKEKYIVRSWPSKSFEGSNLESAVYGKDSEAARIFNNAQNRMTSITERIGWQKLGNELQKIKDAFKDNNKEYEPTLEELNLFIEYSQLIRDINAKYNSKH
ncbi:MAG: hypothetical protein ACP5N2_04965 [Candidatus Nanoarchaeia archaeon]